MSQPYRQFMRAPYPSDLGGAKDIKEHPPKKSALTYWGCGLLAWGFIFFWYFRKIEWVVVVGVVLGLIGLFLLVLERVIGRFGSKN
jgi:hypothetical protein